MKRQEQIGDWASLGFEAQLGRPRASCAAGRTHFKRWIAGALVGSLGLTSPVAAQNFLCVVDQSVGFGVDDTGKDWAPALFNLDEKYVVRPAQGYETRDHEREIGYVVERFGANVPFFHCPREGMFPDAGEPQKMQCDDGISRVFHFFFSFESLRFIETFTLGYLDSRAGEQQKTGYDLYLSIGSCTRTD